MINIPKTAEEVADSMKEISVSQFFEKNKHLLGFDNPTKALMMAVKEAVDNSLDAAQDAGILPDITVKIKQLAEDRYRVSVQDNGPGIVKENVGRVFGKLLYGSKFFLWRQSRGQQGIGISSVVLYSYLTTGEPARITVKTEKEKKGHYFELHVNTAKNEPDIIKQEDVEPKFDHGVLIEIDLKGRYRKTVEDYLKQTSIANPYAKIIFQGPDGTKITYPRSTNTLPPEAKEMKPHPYGVEFGNLQKMIIMTQSRTLQSFLVNEFSSVGAQTAKEICKVAKIESDTKPQSLDRKQIDALLTAIQKVKIQRPPTDCLIPIDTKDLEKSLKSEFPNTEFYTVRSRNPEVYRGFPFMIEVGIVYGGQLPPNEPIQLIRFANRVPLLYQAGACATAEAVKEVDWKRYGLQQSTNSLPVGPMVLVIHMASVWVPFVSESKEAIAPYPEIVEEMKLALQDAGRELSRYLSGRRRAGEAKRRFLIFERYSTEVAESLSELTGKKKDDLEKKLKAMIKTKVSFEDTEEGAEAEVKTEGDKKTVPKKDEVVQEKKKETKKEGKTETKNEVKKEK